MSNKNAIIEFWIQPYEDADKIVNLITADLNEMSVESAEDYLTSSRDDELSPIMEMMEKYNIHSNYNFGINFLKKYEEYIIIDKTPVTYESILEYIQFVYFRMLGVGGEKIFDYERERCRLHQNLFTDTPRPTGEGSYPSLNSDCE